MPSYNKVKAGKTIIGKLDFGKDLIDELTEICVKNDITLGKVQAIGAVKKANLGYYNQTSKIYQFTELDKHLEILSLIGNISTKDESAIIHAHITLGDEKGNAFGGHLAQGTIIFAGEFIIEEFIGKNLSRGFDSTTGLPLWDMA